MYKLILVYLLGIVVAVGLNPDRYFFITIFLVSFITHMSFMISKGQMSFRNVLYKRHVKTKENKDKKPILTFLWKRVL
jgi:enamine deaminase RidA (YjgF/YER057c/UK114 family)